MGMGHKNDRIGELNSFWLSKSTEPIDAVNILPLARFDAPNCAIETSPKEDVKVALILTMANVVHVVYWSCLNASNLFRSQFTIS